MSFPNDEDSKKELLKEKLNDVIGQGLTKSIEMKTFNMQRKCQLNKNQLRLNCGTNSSSTLA